MEGRKRTERTLFYLVLSMCAGALILHLGQPNRALSRPGMTDLIGQTSKPEPFTIYLYPQRLGPSGGAKQAHIFIDREGRRSATDAWVGRKLSDAPMVRIGLQTPSHSNMVTPKQWAAAQEFIGDLRGKLNTTMLRVVLEDGIQAPRGADSTLIGMR